MIIVDTALKKRAEEGRPVRVAVMGTGAIGRGLISIIVNHTPGMKLVAVANRTEANSLYAMETARVERFKIVESLPAMQDALSKGILAITQDPMLVCAADGIDVIIQTVSDIENSAEVALAAFAGGKHLVTANAEMDATFGLELQKRAVRAGVIYTVCDGDQPGVELNLWRYVKSIGMEPLVCGNVKGLQDCRRNPTTQAGFAKQWDQGVKMVTSFADGTKISFEQACVANATGMTIECRGMRGGDVGGHIDDLCHSGRYDLDALRALGGIVDYVVGPKPPGGVYVIATMDDPVHRKGLRLYKMGDGPLYSFYTPYHLCYFEMALSAARVTLFGDTVVTPEEHRIDVVTVAKTPLKAGTVLDGIGGYHSYGVCETAAATGESQFLPMGLSEGCVLKRDIECDALITYDDVEVPGGRLCDSLRASMLGSQAVCVG